MGRDEAMLTAVGEGAAPPTLRFYGWSPATISLGYFQRIEEFEALPPPARDLAVVRRQTGGGAILHDIELTYSLALPLTHEWLSGVSTTSLYSRVHDAFASVLAELGVPVTYGSCEAGVGCSHDGPFFCFERHSRFDLLAEGRKLLGSAQRRTAFAVLQHGSLILDSRYAQQHCATVAEHASIDAKNLFPYLAATLTQSDLFPTQALTVREAELEPGCIAKYAGSEWTRKR
jgi:lipoate-protein ligase A